MSKRLLCLVLFFIALQAEALILDDENYVIDNRAGSPLETIETSQADRLHNDVYSQKLSSLRNAKLLPKEPGEMLFSVVHACVQLLHAEPDSRRRRALMNAAVQESSAMMATYTWDTIADSAERAALAPIDSRRKRRGLSDTSSDSTSQGNSSYDPAAYLAVAIIKEISKGKHIPDCAKRNDPSLPGSLPNNTKFMIGANLKNNEGLLPHFTLQLLKAILPSRPANLHVSIYESGSEDATPKWVAIIELLMKVVGIPNTIVAGGGMRRTPDETRIMFLSKMRNAVLAPLIRTPHYPNGFPADRVVWLNDVWWCAPDMWRLAQYRSADMACGLDFDKVADRRRGSRRLLGEEQEAGAERDVEDGEGPMEGQEGEGMQQAGRGGVWQGQAAHHHSYGPAAATGETLMLEAQHGAGAAARGYGVREMPLPLSKGRSTGHDQGELSDLHQVLSRLSGGTGLPGGTEALPRHRHPHGTEVEGLGSERSGIRDAHAAGGGAVNPTQGVGPVAAVEGSGEVGGPGSHPRLRRLLSGRKEEEEEEAWHSATRGGQGGDEGVDYRGYGRDIDGRDYRLDQMGMWGEGGPQEGHQDFEFDEWRAAWAPPKLSYKFYDIWVARDLSGHKMDKSWPMLNHTASLALLEGGWPFPVQCCWNGLVVLNAQPFRRHGLRFRSKGPGECSGSECTFMCNDFWRLGYTRALVDPSVRQVYEPWEYDALYGQLLGRDVAVRTWAEVAHRHVEQGHALLQREAEPHASNDSSDDVSVAASSGRGKRGQAVQGRQLQRDGAWEGQDWDRARPRRRHRGKRGWALQQPHSVGGGRTGNTVGGAAAAVSSPPPPPPAPSPAPVPPPPPPGKGVYLWSTVVGAHAGTGGSARRQAAGSGSAATSNSSTPTPTASTNTTVVPTTLPVGLVDVVAGRFWAHVTAPDQLECCELSDDPKNDAVNFSGCSMKSWLLPNHTANFLAALARSRHRLRHGVLADEGTANT